MGEMREWWANVYLHDAQTYLGDIHGSKSYAERNQSSHARFRIHVRLKPEGAPKRYAGQWNREAWERAPHICRQIVADGIAPESVD